MISGNVALQNAVKKHSPALKNVIIRSRDDAKATAAIANSIILYHPRGVEASGQKMFRPSVNKK